ncbi:MAG: branched-chain amino acid ABC transporter permease [Armatimonadota bacterium]|nr:branched-chain amino acid ABC transporter permease [Armatimonadota bacterium]MDR7403778.1 branched-chain amino acid ABC transporter permease [Armatimonadota bacterium]
MSIRPSGTFVTTYAQDMAILDRPGYRAGMVLLVAALVLAPVGLGRFIFLLNTIGIFAIGACGLTLLTGLTGQISLGHAAFMALGAYGSAALARAGLPVPLAMVGATALTCAGGMVVGLPSLRIKGLYLAIATLAFQFLTEYALIHATGGVGALSVPPLGVGRWVVRTEVQFYYLLLCVWLLAGAALANLARSRVGLVWMAIRDRDYAAQVLGIPLLHYKALAFGLAAAYAGLAGSLWAHYQRLITTEQFTVGASIDYVAMVVIGGLTSIWGAHLGAAFVVALSQGLKIATPALTAVVPAFAKVVIPLREVLFGTVLIALLIWEPGGLAMLLRKLKRKVDLWPFAY